MFFLVIQESIIALTLDSRLADLPYNVKIFPGFMRARRYFTSPEYSFKPSGA